MNRIMAALFLAVILTSSDSYAGQIYGSLTEGNRGVPAANIKIFCGQNTYDTTTDKQGSYNIHVEQTGKCRFEVTYREGKPSATIYSYSEPARYDFQIVRNQDGSYSLHRR